MSDSPAGSSSTSLVRAIGLWGLAAAIANSTIGGGIFRLPAGAADALGAAAPLAYVVCAVAMGLIVLCVAEAGSRVSLTGGPYAYVEVAFGPFAGFMVGMLCWLGSTLACAGVLNVFGDNASRMFGGADASPSFRAALMLGTLAIATFINVIGIKQGNRLNSVSTLAKLSPLLLLVVVGVFSIDTAKLEITEMPGAGALTRASIVLIFAFAGIESALVPGGEIKDPERTVPRAIFVAMGGITVLYIVLQLVAQGVLGASLATSKTPLADAAGAVFGDWGRQLLMIGVVISTFGYVSAMTLAVPRLLFAFARDGFLPRQLASVHPGWKSPWISILVQSVIVAAMSMASGFDTLALLANVALLLVYFGCAVAAWQLRRKGVQSGGTPFRVPGAAVVPFLACAVIAVLLSSITLAEWKVVLQAIAVATVIYFVTRSHRNRVVRANQ
ncbi:MAG: APC family permease [Gemmatimonas sp.]